MENNPEAETTEGLEEIDLEPAEEIINNLPDNSRGYLIPTLDKVQNIYRYLPEPAMEMLMDFFGVSRAEIYGVISFYPQLRITEPGKYIIKLCYGTACFVKGAPIIGDKIYEKFFSKEYYCYMTGFIAGHPFLGDTDASLRAKRLETPRVKIPRGSVGITEQFCNIYSFESPGGWNIIGNTPINIFDKSNELAPNLINPGDTVKFNQISIEEYKKQNDNIPF